MERRLAAILAADVVGYSRLMEEDEADTFDRVRAHRQELFEPEIEKHHGRIFKLMGDGLLAEFSSVVDSVECAVALQRNMTDRNAGLPEARRIEVRIGVNLGEVIVEGDDRYGEGVNIAARLQQLAEPGGICVSRKVSTEVEKKLAFGFEPMGEQRVKNISEPLQVYRVKVDNVAKRRTTRRAAVPRSLWVTTALVAVLLAAGGGWYLAHRDALSVPPVAELAATATLAVLPFAPVGNDLELDTFASGVTETLTAGLARSPYIAVIARTSTEAYKGKSADIRQIGRELGARYVLEGSVQKSGEKVRIVAQLVDASSGANVWSKRFDRESEDAFALQDAVTEEVLASLSGDRGLIRKKEFELAWGKDSASWEEYEYNLRSDQLFDAYTREDTLKSISVAQEGLKKFPDSSLLKARIAWGYYQLIYGGWSDDIKGDYARAFDFAERSAEGTHTPLASLESHWVMAFLQMEYKNDWDRALQEFKAAVELSPNEPSLVADMAEMLIRNGDPDTAIAMLTRAGVPWNLDDFWASPLFRLGLAYFVKEDYKRALEYLKQDRSSDPATVLPLLAATYIKLGDLSAAQATIAQIAKSGRNVTVALFAEGYGFRDNAAHQRLLAALREAGLPES